MIAVPLISNDKKVGFLRIDFVRQERTCDEEIVKTLMTVGNMLGEVENKTRYETEMEQMAYYDQLTNIPNRMLFGEHIKHAIQSAGRRKDSFCILFLDLDSFKMVNDTLGHQIGDQVLVAVAEKLAKCLRRSDILCRFGGDEFLIMLNHITAKRDIEVVLKKMIQVFEQPIFIEEKTFNVTASIGIAVYPIDGGDKDTLIKNADIAMYQAKNNGKNQYMFCSEEMKEEIAQTMILTNHLYRAMEREELTVVYQPQVDAQSGKVVAAEALLRWNNDELGAVPPDVFIPIAEQTGLIIPIGEWVLQETCRQNKIWQQLGLPPIRVAVNVSVNQLCSVGFIDQVRKILNDTGLDPCYLELEITENIAMQESEFIVRVLSGLKELGVFLAIDDFGIEYSSLSRIKMLPIDRLKLDMHFIKGIVTNEKDRIIVDVIIKLAKKLSLKVIAEGVEELEQLTYLKKKMCDEIQGYYFYKPLSQKEMQEILTSLRLSEK